MVVHGYGSTIAAHHHEFPVGKINDPHHAEDDSQADADQRQRRNGIDEIDPDNDCKIQRNSPAWVPAHRAIGRSRPILFVPGAAGPAGPPEALAPSLPLLIYCFASPGFFFRTHHPPESGGLSLAKGSI